MMVPKRFLTLVLLSISGSWYAWDTKQRQHLLAAGVPGAARGNASNLKTVQIFYVMAQCQCTICRRKHSMVSGKLGIEDELAVVAGLHPGSFQCPPGICCL